MDFPSRQYDLVYTDPPWAYYGDPNKNAAAGKHYPLMTVDELSNLPVPTILKPKAAVFCWATGPLLHHAVELLSAWGLHYRGVAHVWVKTTQAGKIIHGQGVPPTYSKPTTEFLLLATTKPRGRPLPLLDSALPQVVCAPRGAHSAKPLEVRALLERAYGPVDRLEMFARGTAPSGWDVWGNEVETDTSSRNLTTDGEAHDR